MDTASSGADVPKATIVSPIIIFGILKFCAIEDAPSTNKSAPFISSINPNTKSNILTKITEKHQNQKMRNYFEN